MKITSVLIVLVFTCSYCFFYFNCETMAISINIKNRVSIFKDISEKNIFLMSTYLCHKHISCNLRFGEVFALYSYLKPIAIPFTLSHVH